MSPPNIGLLHKEVQMKRRKTFIFFHSSNPHKFALCADADALPADLVEQFHRVTGRNPKR
jgi:hypothetical protein